MSRIAIRKLTRVTPQEGAGAGQTFLMPDAIMIPAIVEESCQSDRFWIGGKPGRAAALADAPVAVGTGGRFEPNCRLPKRPRTVMETSHTPIL